MTDTEDIGRVISVLICPKCGRDLRLETRDGVHHEYALAICPDEHWFEPIRVASQLELDAEVGTRKPVGWCVQCQKQIVDQDDAVNVTLAGNDHVVHSGDCLQEHREQQERLGGASA